MLDAYPDWQIPAHVITMVPTADRQKATVLVRIGFEQLDPRILPDMGVKVTFLRDGRKRRRRRRAAARPTLLVPKAAFGTDNGQAFVVRRAPTTTASSGARSERGGADGDQRRGRSRGLTAGERVVVSPPAGSRTVRPVAVK